MTHKQERRTTFKTAPLPFQGQKHRFLTEYQKALKEFVEGNEIHTLVDLFGGSGLLSHVAKRLYPNLTVVYNDYDDYHIRLQNIDRTNELLSEIRPFAAHLPKEAKIVDTYRSRILEAVEKAENAGFVDYITLSASLLFSGRYATTWSAFQKEGFYNRFISHDYNAAGYLDGLVICKYHYQELFTYYQGQEGVLFVLDPPYLSTDTSTYNSDQYWKLRDYLDVLKVLQGSNYIYFTSGKSAIVDLCRWLSDNPGFRNPFDGAEVRTCSAQLNYSSRYLDMMLYKHR